MDLLVYIQQNKGKISAVSLEALKAAQDIAEHTDGKVTGITFNAEAADLLTKYHIKEVLLIENDLLNTYNPLFYVKTIENIFLSESPNAIFFGHTYETRDWVPRLSARLDIPFISDCIGFKIEDQLTLIRSIYQGKFNSDSVANNNPYIVSFQSGAFRADGLKSGTSTIRKVSAELDNISNSIKPGETFQESETSVDLSQANVIVSVGRGIGKQENLQMVQELATSLGAELASSRPVVDSGWLEPYHQVGSSGQTVAPELYLALGISGAIQHVVGMKGSKNIVVINKDANAPLFEIADYGVKGDIFEIVPNLIAAIQSST